MSAEDRQFYDWYPNFLRHCSEFYRNQSWSRESEGYSWVFSTEDDFPSPKFSLSSNILQCVFRNHGRATHKMFKTIGTSLDWERRTMLHIFDFDKIVEVDCNAPRTKIHNQLQQEAHKRRTSDPLMNKSCMQLFVPCNNGGHT